MWDNPWLYVLFLIVLEVLIIMGLSFLVSLIVSVAARRYSAKTRDTYQKRIVALLPCDDCGECGYSGCQEFAVEVLFRGEKTDLCPRINETVRGEIGDTVAGLMKQMEPDKTDKKIKKRKV